MDNHNALKKLLKISDLMADLDNINDNFRLKLGTKDDIESVDNIVKALDDSTPFNNLRLYRGLNEFKEDYLHDRGFTFKSSSFDIAFGYANDTILIIDYPGESHHIFLEDEEFTFISYPGEIFHLNCIESKMVNNRLMNLYYLSFVGFLYSNKEYYEYYERYKCLQKFQNYYINKLKRHGSVNIHAKDNNVYISSDSPYKSLSRNIIYLKNILKELFIKNEL